MSIYADEAARCRADAELEKMQIMTQIKTLCEEEVAGWQPSDLDSENLNAAAIEAAMDYLKGQLLARLRYPG